ncbi:hypothetical protein Pgy4_37891, partial [Pseudomonas savastanoi pv. glycinea str. race 4]
SAAVEAAILDHGTKCLEVVEVEIDGHSNVSLLIRGAHQYIRLRGPAGKGEGR